MIKEMLNSCSFFAIFWNKANQTRPYITNTYDSQSRSVLSLADDVECLPGPPKTRMTSLEEPPLSEIGIT